MLRRIGSAFRIFYNSQRFTGGLLILCTILSLGIANSSLGVGYSDFWKANLFQSTNSSHLPSNLQAIINDVLMAFFFLLVGLEIKREALSGELSSFQRASLPVAAALGGMIFPALIYFFFNRGLPSVHGWGIPMATDIAFAIGILSLLGSRIPDSLKLLLTALAVADDLGAVLVIAIFYSDTIHLLWLSGATITLMALYLMNKKRVKSLTPYLLVGAGLWFFVHQSGIHATIAGVLLAFFIPYDSQIQNDPLQRLEHLLHRPVSHLVMPLFAMANTSILIQSEFSSILTDPMGLGISAGLFLGKPLGILLFVWLAIKMGASKIPEGVGLQQILGIGMLGGIGFTMSIFVAMLAFEDANTVETAKLSILIASLASALAGLFFLRYSTRTDD
ncbi:MAG: Na+/H+ antiporter NhaA [Bacteroidota bacterium]